LEKGRCCELQEGDVALVEQEIGKGRLGIELSTARPTAAEEELRRARGQTSPVEEQAIGRCDEC
jgi:hypothetical protein